METKSRILIEEYNVISLRTAFVIDDGECIGLQLFPVRSSLNPMPDPRSNECIDWLKRYSAFLYQHYHTQLNRHAGIKMLRFVKTPEFEILWSDTGNSVAVCLNGEPWAFIDEQTEKSYSKGVLAYSTGNPWNQELFEKGFQA
jgi:hypothetical protein